MPLSPKETRGSRGGQLHRAVTAGKRLIIRIATPKYHYFVVGDPDPPEMDEVESGIYHPKARPPFPVGLGDLLLLYCTGSYAAHPMEVPGIGVATRIDHSVVEYR